MMRAKSDIFQNCLKNTKPSRSEPNEPKKLGAILADNQTDLNAIDDENNNPLFDELAEQKGAN